MDAVKFLQERARMCNSFSPDCEGCRVDEEKPVMSECYQWMFENSERAVEIVEEWAAAHPRKTRQTTLLKQYPEAEIDSRGCAMLCPKRISADSRKRYGSCTNRLCADCRKEFWGQEIE